MSEHRSDYRYEIVAAPDFGMVNITIPQGKTLKAEASAMTFMDSSLNMKTKMKGGFRRLFTGENLFINEVSATKGEGEIGLAPGAPGDIGHRYLDAETIFLQSSAYLASSPEIEAGVQFQGFKGFFSGEKLFMIRCSGTGDLWFNTFGGLVEVDVTDNYVVDTGYIVGFTSGLAYDVTSVGGLKSLFFSGEGLVCRFSGEGKVWIQTRQNPAFVTWADQFRRIEKKDKN